MNSVKKLLLAISLIATLGLIYFFIIKNNSAPTPNTADLVNAPSEETGFLPEKIIGNPETAELTIYEYADFGCSHCAEWNKVLNDLLEKHNQEIALVFRNYNTKLFQNSPLAARAATAAQIQGYFKDYKDLLFSNQAEWLSEDETNLKELFANYFKTASNNAGDLEKFKTDLESDAVEKRLDFEQSLGKQIHLTGTPMFRIDEKTIKLEKLLETIEQKLN